jgi:fatty-acyl-CoA synthase
MNLPSYTSGYSTVPLLGETIGRNLDRAIAAHPDAEALVVPFQDVRMTYEEFGTAVEQLARALVGRGLRRGDRVGIWSPNCAEWVVVQYATAKAGLILVNLNPAYRTAELEYALRQSGCRMLISAHAFKRSDYPEMVAEVAPLCPELEETVLLASPQWEELAASAEGVLHDQLQAREAEVQFDDPVNIQYTSGTTGSPKGATLSHHNILNNGFVVGDACGYSSNDRVCIPVPFYHCFGMVMGNLGCTSHGATIVVPAPVFDAGATLKTVETERCTSLYGVPTMFIAELEHPDFPRYDLASLRTGIMAGSPCPVEVMRRVIARMHMSEVTICYGMTETSPVSTQTARDDSLENRVGTVGRVHPHQEIKLIDAKTGAIVPRGQSGELCTRGYSVMLGYWNDPERTGEAIDTSRWMHTGDLATMDENGYVRIVGRSKDMIIRGGENVYPREIEEFLHQHPDVADVQVVGVPDPRYGEEIAAVVIPREGATLGGQALREFCAGRIAHYKVPRHVLEVEEFPMTVTGKVQKFKLREQVVVELQLTDSVAPSP